jgi:hypothetical protein
MECFTSIPGEVEALRTISSNPTATSQATEGAKATKALSVRDSIEMAPISSKQVFDFCQYQLLKFKEAKMDK